MAAKGTILPHQTPAAATRSRTAKQFYWPHRKGGGSHLMLPFLGRLGISPKPCVKFLRSDSVWEQNVRNSGPTGRRVIPTLPAEE
jgi:hypothetical protein